MRFLILIILCLFIINIKGHRYSLPGDRNWPTASNFLDFKKSISGNVVFRGDNNYNPHTWNRITNIPKPAAIVQPIYSQDVIEALKFARKYNIRLSVQSTGHHQDHRNIFDNSIHLDMSTMNEKSIDLTKRTVTLGPGNNFSQIHSYISAKSNQTLIAISGADPGVGIYGWTVGGGHGSFTRQYGLGVDSLVSIDLVLANYSIITASETQNSELFRAIRGSGGGTYGIALSLTVKLFDNPGVMSTFGGLYELSNKTAVMFGNWMINAPNRAVAYFLPRNIESKYVTISAYCFGNTSYCKPILSKLQEGCIPIEQLDITCNPSYERYKNFYEFFSLAGSDTGGVVYLSSTALNTTNILAALQDAVTFIDKNSFTICSGNSVLGGVSSMIDLNQEKTSVALDMRQGLMALSCGSIMEDSSTIEVRKYQVGIMDDFAENVLKKHSKWVFWNEAQHNFPKDDWRERYWGGLANYNRLLAVKQKYDPANIFTCYHCIGYERIDNELPSVCPVDKCTCSNTPNGECSNVPNIQWGNTIFSCNFDDSTSCSGKFTYNTNGQQAGLFESSNTSSTQLAYDITDFTSIHSLTKTNQTCKFPFIYNSKNNNFCVKMSDAYKCQTSQGYSYCNLGKYFGVRTTIPSGIFDINWETNSFITLPNVGKYSLQFYAYYNCYQTKSLFDFFASDCLDVKDLLTIYTKYSSNELYSTFRQIDLTKKNSVESWQLFKFDLNSSSNALYIKIKFERVVAASKGEALFGLDNLSLIDQS